MEVCKSVDTGTYSCMTSMISSVRRKSSSPGTHPCNLRRTAFAGFCACERGHEHDGFRQIHDAVKAGILKESMWV